MEPAKESGMCRLVRVGILIATCLIEPSFVSAAQPVDPDLIPEARRVLDYLESVCGKKTLAGMSNWGGAGWRAVYEISGRAPAVCAWDATGWNSPTWGPSYCQVLQGYVDSSRRWWQDKGGIVTMQWHWSKPGDPNGSAWVGRNKSGPMDVGKAVTPGTEEYKAALEDLRRTADYVEQLAKARVPVLWRPLHEIDGGWFWWTDGKQPENTAALWRMMFDYFVKERKLHNLIWIYSAGVHAAGTPPKATMDQEIAHRKRFYPGDGYVDIAGIDIYPGGRWGAFSEDAYGTGYDIMKGVAPGKMLALSEASAIPDPDRLAQQGPGWLYALPWYSGGDGNPPAWIRRTFTHEHVITLDELPALAPHNVAPDVRLVEPGDGAQIGKTPVEFKARASDRNGNLNSVEFFLLPGPWRNWDLRDEAAVTEALSQATRLGDGKLAPDGVCTFTWADAPAGFHNLVAVARDTEAKSSCSNIARVSVGLKNLARGRTVQASSDAKNASRVVDGDLFSAWSGDKKGEQGLTVDLGSEQMVGGAVVVWWKAYAKSFRIEISSDGATWKEVYRNEKKTDWRGDSDVIRFEPVKARHVRLLCSQPGTPWGGYVVYELGVYEAVPDAPQGK
jgi:hypothetical protein